MNTGAQLRIVCDNREQDGFTFAGKPAVVESGTLEAGDYSLRGFERSIAIERKSLPDLVCCLSTERDRFQRELSRLRGFAFAAVVVESPASELRGGNYRAQLHPFAAWQTILAFSQRYRLPFFFCDTRADAEQITFDLLRHFHRDRVRELTALTESHGGENIVGPFSGVGSVVPAPGFAVPSDERLKKKVTLCEL